MSHQYRCGRCGITSQRTLGRGGAEYLRRAHRDEAHDGHIPDGEEIARVPTHPGDLPIQWYAVAAVAIFVFYGDTILGWL